jgi:hypothetical protein
MQGARDRLRTAVGDQEVRKTSKKQLSRKLSARKKQVTWDAVRQLALALSGVEDGTSYGTPALKVAGKLLVRLREDQETIAIRVELAAREVLIGNRPEAYYVTDHYRCYPWMLVRLAGADAGDLRDLIQDAWRRNAPKRLVASRERASATIPSGRN